MNGKQNDDQNQNQQRSDHNSNSASSSSSSSNYRGLPHDPDRNSSNNNIVIGDADQVNSEQNRMLNSDAIRGNQASRRDPLNPEQIQQLYDEVGEILAANLNRMKDVDQIQENLTVSMRAMTAEGCECLQRMLAAEADGGGGGLRETVLAELAADLPILMVHNIGFVFVRAFFFSCDERQMNRVLQSVVVGNELAFVYISNNYFGREVIKALIQNLKNEAQLHIVTNILQNYIIFFTNYEHGQNVLQFFIYTCNNDLSRTRLFNIMANNCRAIATNELGCRILRCSICPMYIQGGLILSLIEAVVAKACVLANDKCGNYLIRHVIDANIEGVTKRIVGELMGRFCDLAKSDFGSIVVQKCLRNCEQSEVVKIVKEFTNSSQLCSIAQDYFGHCVLLCALEHIHTPGSIEHFHNLARGINRRRVSTIQRHFYRKKVIEKVNQLNRDSPFQLPQ